MAKKNAFWMTRFEYKEFIIIFVLGYIAARGNLISCTSYRSADPLDFDHCSKTRFPWKFHATAAAYWPSLLILNKCSWRVVHCSCSHVLFFVAVAGQCFLDNSSSMNVITASKLLIVAFVGSVTLWYFITPYIVKPHKGIVNDMWVSKKKKPDWILEFLHFFALDCLVQL